MCALSVHRVCILVLSYHLEATNMHLQNFQMKIRLQFVHFWNREYIGLLLDSQKSTMEEH